MFEFLIFLAFLWFIVSAVRGAANQAQKTRSKVVVPPPDWFAAAHEELPPSHVRRVGAPAPALLIPARSGSEESTSELLWDDEAVNHDRDLEHAEVVSLEVEVPEMSLVPRALPAAAVSLETEVDWEHEHQRFHQRFVDARPRPEATGRGLMDDLRDPGGARRAVLMAEILGPPVSMRR